jgi:hypothetical protein
LRNRQHRAISPEEDLLVNRETAPLTLVGVARFFTPAWLVRHVLALVLTVGFTGLGWWQWERATAGNGLSWAYTFEWPLFAIFTAALWLREVRAELKRVPSAAETQPPLSSPFQPDDEIDHRPSGDQATDDYNRYLAWLAANPHRRPSEYPG